MKKTDPSSAEYKKNYDYYFSQKFWLFIFF